MSYAKFWTPVGVAAALACAASAESDRNTLQHHEIKVEKELLIRATEVVDSPRADYPGAWSFGHLFEQAYGEGARHVVAAWLAHWSQGQPAESRREAVPPRPGLVDRLVRPWQAADGYDPESGGRWVPDLSNAPFRLLAIVNRLDLAVPISSQDPRSIVPESRSPYSSSGSLFADKAGGEARFVFAVTDQNGNALTPGTTIIFEYGLDVLKKKQHLLEWAAAWHELGVYDDFNAFYLHDLEELTRAFTDRRATESAVSPFSSPPMRHFEEWSAKRYGHPLRERLGMGSGIQPTQLLRIRTNDGSFGEEREFREFERQRSRMAAAPLPGTPRETFFRPKSEPNRWMSSWVNRQSSRRKATLIRDQVVAEPELAFRVPVTGSNAKGRGPVVAMVSPVRGGSASYHWNGVGVDPHRRHSFSSQSCCGCHCGDTNTEFFHVFPRERGEQAKLSRFLRTDGSTFVIKDPASGAEIPSAEMEVRAKVLKELLNQDLDQYQVAEILSDS